VDQAEGVALRRARQRWMGVLARASTAALERAWAALEAPPAYDFLRRPEIGMVMVRARAGGNGQRFNLGEMTVTRCTLRLAAPSPDAGPEQGLAGTAYVAGRDARKAELAAAFDALLQDPLRRPALLAAVVEPLAAAQAAARRAAAAKAAASRVEFFTVAREAGETAGAGAGTGAGTGESER